jgi:hypothetical protein
MESFRRAASDPAGLEGSCGATVHVASTGGPAMYYIGIDVSLRESALCVLDGRGKIVRETKLPPTLR